MDYKKEVLKVYPDAWCQTHPFWYWYYVGTNETLGWLSRGTNLSESEAWKNAYTRLVEQGLIPQTDKIWNYKSK